MGFLTDNGETLSYEDSKKFLPYIKEQGLKQLMGLLARFAPLKNDEHPFNFKWGDEGEYHIVNLDDENKRVRIQINPYYLYNKFSSDAFQIQFEYGAWMVEAVPKAPFMICDSLETVVTNIAERRKRITELLDPQDRIMPVPSFPLLGCPDYETKNKYVIEEEAKKIEVHENEKKEDANIFSGSRFTKDYAINIHNRFRTLTHNIRQRRGGKVMIKIPLFVDEKTDTTISDDEPYPGYIYMDSMAFGMGACCIQCTYSTFDIDQARHLYDQFAVLSPLFLALTAGSPIFKGKLANTDTRWSVISQSVDDRTLEERDPNHSHYIPKSRYDSISYFISNGPKFKKEYNDLKFRVNEEAMRLATNLAKDLSVDLDETFLQHIGFLYVRDPLVIFKDKVISDDSKPSTSHFENIQSTNWNSVRFKPPPAFDSEMGWRVEFRTMEIQLTEEENGVFLMLVTFLKILICHASVNANFYIPITLVDENFKEAEKKDAIRNGQFWWRKNFIGKEADEAPQYVKLNLHQIMFGNESDGMPGLITVLEQMTQEMKSDSPKNIELITERQSDFMKIREFIYGKTSGSLMTLSQYTRDFVQKHPAYKRDSVVSPEIAYDLAKLFTDINMKKTPAPELLGSLISN